MSDTDRLDSVMHETDALISGCYAAIGQGRQLDAIEYRKALNTIMEYVPSALLPDQVLIIESLNKRYSSTFNRSS